MRITSSQHGGLIGRTLIYRQQFWLVEAVESGHVWLTKTHDQKKGVLRLAQLRDCRLYPTRDELRRRYPRLLQLLRQTCLLTSSEAESALEGYLTSGSGFYGSEAVARIGGAWAAIRHALQRRRYCRGLVH